MSEDQNPGSLNYKAGPLSALVIFILSLFMQWFIWYLFEKIGFGWGYMLLLPLILCMMYHFVQTDSGKNGNFSRRFCFIFSVIAPLVSGVLLTLIMRVSSPDMSIFDPAADYSGSTKEIIATYAGRFIYTSAYLLIFAVIDIPLSRMSAEKRTRK